MSSRRIVVLAMGFALCAGCGRAKPAPKDSVVALAPVATAPGSAPLCQRTGHWSECTVRIMLDQAGLVPRPGAEKVGDLPKLVPKPIVLRIGDEAGIAYYLYPDAAARKAAAATLDTSRFIAQTRRVSMKHETTMIENDNVLVLLFSRDEHRRERVADVITAGAPQP